MKTQKMKPNDVDKMRRYGSSTPSIFLEIRRGICSFSFLIVSTQASHYHGDTFALN